MNRATSIYLDFVRFFAALIVFFTHASYARLGGQQFIPFTWFSLEAVMTFFVLSGFVIAFVSENKDSELYSFFLSRASRLYSVVLPAILVTVVVDAIGSRLDPTLYDGWWYAGSNPIFRVVTSLTFSNELWGWSVRPFTNGPFWSVGYEAWYYIFFACAAYFSGRRRVLLMVAALVVMGPKILLLLPVWLTGVAAYRVAARWNLGPAMGGALFAASLLLALLYWKLQVRSEAFAMVAGVVGERRLFQVLHQSRDFVASWLFGVVVALNFVGFSAVSTWVEAPLRRIERPIRFLASFTFSLYLLHYPLLHFYYALTHRTYPGMVLTLLTIFAIGAVTERKKHLFKRWIDQAVCRMRGGLVFAGG